MIPFTRAKSWLDYGYSTFHIGPQALPWMIKYLTIYPVYWFLQGTMMWALFVLGHDCGHGSFSKSRILNDIVGNFLHSIILVTNLCCPILILIILPLKHATHRFHITHGRCPTTTITRTLVTLIRMRSSTQWGWRRGARREDLPLCLASVAPGSSTSSLAMVTSREAPTTSTPLIPSLSETHSHASWALPGKCLSVIHFGTYLPKRITRNFSEKVP